MGRGDYHNPGECVRAAKWVALRYFPLGPRGSTVAGTKEFPRGMWQIFKVSSGGLQGGFRVARVEYRTPASDGEEEEERMVLRTVLRATAVGGALMLVSGCATAHTHSAQSICEAAGGTYAQNTCQPGTPRSGRQICEKMDARWIEDLAVCEFQGRGGA
jgi:hypothetical protein